MEKDRDLEEGIRKKKSVVGKKALLLLCAAAAAAGTIFLVKEFPLRDRKEEKPEIITESALYKIINVNRLSTYQCIYNDICAVADPEDASKTAYYCAYESKVDAGIDFSRVTIDLDEEAKVITVTIPKVELTVNVDISSLDYMFEDDRVNTSGVSEQAYKACIADVEKKSSEEGKIYELAEENAENMIKALITPFLTRSDAEYRLEIKTQEVAR